MSVNNRNLYLGLFGMLLAMATAASAEPNALHLLNFEEPHMGTLFTIRLYAENEEAAKAAFEKVAALESVFSDYDATSEVLRLVGAPHGEPVKVGDDLIDATLLALSLSAALRRVSPPTPPLRSCGSMASPAPLSPPVATSPSAIPLPTNPRDGKSTSNTARDSPRRFG